jgi:ClpP class serine protease
MKRRSSAPPQAYKRTGILAVHPQAFLELFVMPESRENEQRDNVIIVDICGPLTQHDDGFFDSYEAIRGRVQAACASAAAAIVLRIDSPGGDCAGCFDTARAIRTMCELARKPLWAHVDGKACSAGYALAAAAATVCIGDTGIVGSIGIVSARPDVSAANAAQGIRVALVASGARKVDGNPDAPITDAELKATQELVDSMAEAFFELVADLRGKPAASIAGLQAAVFHRDTAKGAGLVDAVQSFDQMLATIASGGTVMASSYEKAKAALEEAAEGDDANAAAAKRALAAMEEPKPDAEAEPDGDEPPKEKKDDEKAEGDPPKPDDEDEKKAAAAASAPGKAAASTHDIALTALTKVNQLEAQLARERLKSERDALLASRPDLPPELLPVLRGASLATVRDYFKSLPKSPSAKAATSVAKPAAPATVTGTRGAGQGGPGAQPAAAANEMDRAMGLTTTVLACRREGNALKFGVMEVPAAQSAPAGGAK